MSSVSTRPRWRSPVAAVVATAAVGVGCETYRVEYRERPPFYSTAGVQLPKQQTLPDGTVVVYRDRALAGALQDRAEAGDDERLFRIREKLEDGRIVLRALLPEHVLANLITCIRNEEYELLWNQLLAERTKRAYEEQGGGPREFAQFFGRYRHQLAETVNRMSLGLLRNEIVVDNLGGGVTRYRFHPTVAGQLEFKTILMVSEPSGLKLMMIR